MPTGADFNLGTPEPADEHGAESAALFCEMLELRPGQSSWRETVRWVKFEEDVEEDGNRWSKPFVAALKLHALMELRNCISSGSVLLDLQTNNLNEIWNTLVNEWVRMDLVPASYHEPLVATLMQPYRHQHQFQRSIIARNKSSDVLDPASSSSMRKYNQSLATMPSVNSMSSVDTLSDALSSSPTGDKTNKRFFKKLPPGSEAASILVAELEFLRRPLTGFVRLRDASNTFRGLVEVPVPVRYVFVALSPKTKGNRVRELGRTMGTLFSDELFQHEVSKARDRHDLLTAIDDFMGSSTVLPPGEWNPKIRIEPPTQVQSKESRTIQKKILDGEDVDDHSDEHTGHGAEIKRTGRICGGIMDDIKRKAKWYLADFKDALHIQTIASIIFLYFASMTPLVTFGGLMSTLLKGRMGAMETILGRAISGVFWGFTAGQPLVILGSTGPILVFEVIVFNVCDQWGIEYMSMRVWIGLWSALILLFMVIFDSSFLVGFITRFTEESFAALVSAIFVYEAIKKVLHIAEEEPIQTNPLTNPDISHLCDCLSVNNETVTPFGENFTNSDCLKGNGTLIGIGCNTPHYVPDAFLLSVLLFFGTFIMSRILKNAKTASYGPARLRQIISDFAVILSIATFVIIDFLMGIPTPKLWVPAEVKPTYEGRDSWLVPFFGGNPWWTALAAAVPGALATILIFMDQQITTVIVSRGESKLRHGVGYHLDLFIVAILTAVLSMVGMPWMIADTVLSLTHSSSLRMESEVAAPGERPTFLGIRENRVTNIIISILVGVSVFLGKYLVMIPMPVLFGVFLFMGSNALMGLQFTDRIKLFFMPLKYQPDHIYLRYVSINRVHLFTLIQLLCLAVLWVLKSFRQTAMLFPIMVGALCGVRYALNYVFTRQELKALDDLMPEGDKKKKANARKMSNVTDKLFKVDGAGVLRIPLPTGNILTLPLEDHDDRHVTSSPSFADTVESTKMWRNLSVLKRDAVQDEKNGAPLNARWTKEHKEEEAKTLLKEKDEE
ncbi:Sodium-driven chloride bicarbonate exchanger [Hypsibius exemplaris]|uniref:Anion exchange protein n=1 Tax=Hypsibius exemplaris TaxID=2072580 RepID=A0A9X6RKZ3_HYPEX|nr:Sodium-driven chloride bicarbonate exchanger [Hypsibius exemplaris]